MFTINYKTIPRNSCSSYCFHSLYEAWGFNPCWRQNVCLCVLDCVSIKKRVIASNALIYLLQNAFLEDWASLERNHSISLLGAIEALKASTLRLPVVGAIVCPIFIPKLYFFLSSVCHPHDTHLWLSLIIWCCA